MGKTGASDKPAVLSIGAVVGGTTPAARAWGDAAMVLARDVAELRPAIESPLNINVVFHVPGEVLSPDWEGVRTGTYRRRDNHLMVQLTVPATPPEDPRQYLVERLHEAVEEAERWATRKGIVQRLAGPRSILSRL